MLSEAEWRALRVELLSTYDSKVKDSNLVLYTAPPNYVMWRLRAGSLRLKSESEMEFTLHPGDGCLLPPSYKRLQAFDEESSIFSCHFIAEWPGGVPFFALDEPLIASGGEFDCLAQYMKRMTKVGEGSRPDKLSFAAHMERKAALLEMLVELWGLLDSLGVGMNLPRRLDPRVVASLEVLDRCRLTSVAPYEELTAVSGLSRVQLDRVFQSELGKTPSKYLEHRRLRAAIDLLTNTSLSAKEACFELNFADPPQFSKWLKRLTGRTPASFLERRGRG